MKNNIRTDISNSICVITLGCSKNVVDSEYLIGDLKSNNFNIAENPENAETIIINTCGFINPAKDESIRAILGASELKSQHKIKKIFVTGCLSQRYSERLKETLQNVDEFFGVNSNKEILDVLLPETKYHILGNRQLLTPSYYAYLKISEGCDHKCSFCAIPLIRGEYISKTMESIIYDVQKLIDQGVKEFNIIAQDTTFYGYDLYGKRRISELLEKISSVSGVEWLRLLYTYPTNFPFELLDIISENENICNYIDIPLQHISEKILKSMKRGTSKDYIYELIDKIRKKIPGVAIRSTFIVGYPGETERDFRELYDFILDTRLDRVGVFSYSHEEDTSAYHLKDSVPDQEKEYRKGILMKAQQSISLEKNKMWIGKDVKVIIDESNDKKNYSGRTEYDAPDVDNAVIINSSKKLEVGSFYNVNIIDAQEYDLIAKI